MKTALVLAGAAALVIASVQDARACTPALAPSGYITEIVTTSRIVEDSTTAQVCELPGNSCGKEIHYAAVQHVIDASPTATDAPAAGKENTYAGPGRGRDPIKLTMKDAAGTVVEELTLNGVSASFTKLGTTVCIKTTRKPEVDAGAGDTLPNESEVCSPVTVTTLDVTDDERAKHQEVLDKFCPGSTSAPTVPKSNDGGALGTKPASDEDSGCSVGHGSTVSAWLAGIALALVVARRKRR